METESILAERAKTHGSYKVHARITQDLKSVMQVQEKWAYLSNSQREALEMIVHKIGRILAGNSNFADHWDDIAGYSKLVSKEIAETPTK
jgi:hypothetical protein